MNEFDQFEVDYVDACAGSVRMRHMTCRQNVGPLIRTINLSKLYQRAAQHMASCPALKLHGIVYDDGDAIEFPGRLSDSVEPAGATRARGAAKRASRRARRNYSKKRKAR